MIGQYFHKLNKMEIVCKSDALTLRIFINDILYLFLDKKKLIGLQSWYINEWDLKIEIYTTDRDILLEYNSLEKWKRVLALINENI